MLGNNITYGSLIIGGKISDGNSCEQVAGNLKVLVAEKFSDGIQQ